MLKWNFARNVYWFVRLQCCVEANFSVLLYRNYET